MNFTLCLTRACNMRCSYCYAVDKRDAPMTWETAQQAIDFSLAETLSRARLRGRAAVTQLGYFGGEPLLEWDLLQRSAAYADAECARLDIILKKTVTTNMSLLDVEKSAWLRDRQFHVGLSLDGTADRHDRLRRMADGSPSHARCAAALRYFGGADATYAVILVIDPLNVDGLAASLGWLVEQDLRSFILNPNFHARWSADTLARWHAEIKKIGGLYAAGFRAGRPLRIDVFDSKIEAHIANRPQGCEQCGFGGTEIAIAPDGAIYPCVRIVGADHRKGVRIGHVNSGIDWEALRRIAPSGSLSNVQCADCAARARCENRCACVNLATTGEVNRVSGVVCHHERRVIETADAVAEELFAERNPAFLARFYQTHA
ncbi:MAG: radical SAM protein [Verrucomicrobiota bacterium]